jgi:alpha-tubulin suppressor-like RCC1 family protein
MQIRAMASKVGYLDSSIMNKTYTILEPVPVTIENLSCDYGISLVHLSNGVVYTWGTNYGGYLGNGNYTSQDPAVQVIGDHEFVYAGVYQESTWGIDSDGQLWVWGDTTYGRWGNGYEYNQQYDPPTSRYWYHTPLPGGGMNPGDHIFTKVRMGGWHGLGLDTEGRLWGWGEQYSGGGDACDRQGECGLGQVYADDEPAIPIIKPYGPVLYPVQEYLGKTNWTYMWCGWNFSLAIDSDGKLYGTGSDGCAALLQGYWAWHAGLKRMHWYSCNKDIFTQIGVDTDWVKVRAGDCHVIAQKSNGDLYGWGYNVNGCLGGLGVAEDNYVMTSTKLPFTGSEVADFYCGAYHTGVLKTDGTMWTTGDNGSGQLGVGDYNDRNAFTQVIGGHIFTQVCDQAYDHSMAADADGNIYAWGWYLGPNEPAGWEDHTPNLIDFDFVT